MAIARKLATFVLLLHCGAGLAAEQIVEGVVSNLRPLEVKRLNGEIRRVELDRIPVPPHLAKGDLLQLTYDVTPKAVVLRDARISGGTVLGTIVEIAEDKSWLLVRTRATLPDREVTVPLQTSDRFKALVTAMRAGDGVQGVYKGVDPYAVQTLEWQRAAVTHPYRWLSLLLAVVALFAVAFAFTKGHPTRLYLGADNRYSSSKFQVVLWFWIVVSAYLAILFHRISAAGWSYVGGVDIPQNLLILSGISVLTFASAKLITVGKVEQSTALGEPGKQPAKNPTAGDLIRDDQNRTDLGDYQMIVITVLAVVIYAISVVEFMQYIEYRRVVTMPDVDATLLALFGLGQAAYLGKKAAGEGATFDPAVKSASASADAAKEASAKAEAAAKTASASEAEVKRAAEAVTAAASKIVAEPEAAKARNAASAAAEAKVQAASALQTAESQLAAVKKLADTWAKDVDGAAALKPILATVEAEVAKARSAASSASAAAARAAAGAKAAEDEAAQKP